jgi:UDP-glucose:(heptosyl)LPS alpha-1,3-glucosyltransferase
MAADGLAHPTLEDTFAMVVLEAMAHGLPVVVSGARYCGIAGLLVHEQQALLLSDPQDADALAGALSRIVHDVVLVARLSSEAMAFAQQHQWATLAHQQETIYLEFANRS